MYRRNARTGIIWGCKVSYNKMVVDSRQRDESWASTDFLYEIVEQLSVLNERSIDPYVWSLSTRQKYYYTRYKLF